MKLYLDTQFLDLVLEQWAKGEHDYSKVYELPIFQAFWKHQEDYLHRPLSKEKCLHDLLFIDDIDMESHKEEIVRNMNYIREIDLDMVLQHVKRYLPKECLCADRDVPIHLMIGIAGMALNDAIIMDPSPCPWFVNDGSNKEKYVNEHFIPVLAHELHHIGYKKIRQIAQTRKSKTTCELAANLLCELQMEGGAQLCESSWDGSAISAQEKEELKGSWKEIQSILIGWIDRGLEIPTKADWDALTNGWRSGLFYRSTLLMCKALISDGYYASVADCMLDEPLAVYEKMSRLLE